MFISCNVKFTFHSTTEFWCMLWCIVITTDCFIIHCSVWLMLQSGLLSFKWFVSTNLLKRVFFVCVCMCDIFPLHYNLLEQPLKWYYVKSISYLFHCYIPLLHLVMSPPSCPFSGSVEQPFIAQGLSETLQPQHRTKTWMLAVKVLFFQQNSI